MNQHPVLTVAFELIAVILALAVWELSGGDTRSRSVRVEQDHTQPE